MTPVLVSLSLCGGASILPLYPYLPSSALQASQTLEAWAVGEATGNEKMKGMKQQDHYLIILAAQMPPDPLCWAS